MPPFRIGVGLGQPRCGLGIMEGEGREVKGIVAATTGFNGCWMLVAGCQMLGRAGVAEMVTMLREID